MTVASGARILIVDDDPALGRSVQANLAGHGFDVDLVTAASEALSAFNRKKPDVVLLDLGLPDRDGLEVIKELRLASAVPIVVLSARETEQDKVQALQLGADDYLTKPFGVDELLARIRVALRHAARPPAGSAATATAGDLRVDFERRLVTRGQQEIHLSPTEYEMLKVLISNLDRVVTDQALLRGVWGRGYGDEAHYLHVYVARLRKKIEPDPRNPVLLVTEPGIGYRLLGDDSRP
ncbi:MAG: response regulator transcription factor [Dehalococcoidia bacterium]